MYNTIAYYYMTAKNMEKAKECFEKYIELYPEGYNPYDSMGEYYMNSGDMSNSKKYYTMAVEKYPFSSSSVEALKKINDSSKNQVADKQQ
jgi:pentatricopeptide repeat protein